MRQRSRTHRERRKKDVDIENPKGDSGSSKEVLIFYFISLFPLLFNFFEITNLASHLFQLHYIYPNHD